MVNKTLALILAAGEGSRVRPFLDEDEPVKAMIKVGDSRLIDLTLSLLEKCDLEKAVLSFPSKEFDALDERVKQYNGVKILKQRAKRRKLPTLLELPYILLMQYYFSPDREYLLGFDSILTTPCDIVFDDLDIGQVMEFHNDRLKKPDKRQITIVAKTGEGEGKQFLFKTNRDRIKGVKPYKNIEMEDYQHYTPAGIYVFSGGILKMPFMAILGPRYNDTYLFLTESSWIDYGNPPNLLKLKNS